MVTAAMIKTLYFIRIYEQFGFLVQMVLLTFIDVVPFTTFMVVWIVYFAMTFMIVRWQIEPDPTDDELEYPEINVFMKYFLQSYRNSIGDLATPDYEWWLPGEDENKSMTGVKYIMVNAVWFVWFANQFVNLIILLNFLIAVISQTYEKVISAQQTHNYLHKSQLNREYYELRSFFGWTSKIKALSFTNDSQFEGESDDEWKGLISAMKKHIDSSVSSLQSLIGKQGKLLDQKIEKIFYFVKNP
mmetsp:Transcript_3352/g.5063  ORF Transcript_3352/g.5063 Transcript_3352/m.5063 type:complete len:244 (-) Transcript_3352:104-835(-)